MKEQTKSKTINFEFNEDGSINTYNVSKNT